ncbi:hypothetical protein J4G33_06345 [Actinotalea sp. BY-33]|uniref:Uncharacterized protein n=1 Tax=Actinotalea soli TaxID=2819234 RepID=A0A939RUJ6_9CELL|nr:hypothetical protein [Actinotalea soli]MBO1751420.1 hypothetical protein [Actinotalea soli]
MDQLEVMVEDLDRCAAQVRSCADGVGSAVARLRGSAPSTGRPDTTALAASAARALTEELERLSSVLSRASTELIASAEAYRSVDAGVAALLRVE